MKGDLLLGIASYLNFRNRKFLLMTSYQANKVQIQEFHKDRFYVHFYF